MYTATGYNDSDERRKFASFALLPPGYKGHEWIHFLFKKRYPHGVPMMGKY